MTPRMTQIKLRSGRKVIYGEAVADKKKVNRRGRRRRRKSIGIII